MGDRLLPDRVDRGSRGRPRRVLRDAEAVLERAQEAVVVVGVAVDPRLHERPERREGHVAAARELL